jgi:hypothetical protein
MMIRVVMGKRGEDNEEGKKVRGRNGKGNNGNGKRDWDKIIGALVIAFAVISFWRGLWGLWDVYVFPGNYVLSLWVSVIVGLVILFWNRRIIDQFIY